MPIGFTIVVHPLEHGFKDMVNDFNLIISLWIIGSGEVVSEP